ncbi:4Fe-4S ferredoxin [Mycolicibacterium brisbanense]|uniref:Ferredoxin n=2 Tax=Mycolicibacterium brisbanense TaxID=146020 RepID=A0A100W2I3_9MYCO|nr:4Fe-4S ferredoxin [Mycolicibacterium brisbanense]
MFAGDLAPNAALKVTLVLCDKDFRPTPSLRLITYGVTMPYVIGTACVDVMHKACVLQCPVDCIYEGARSLYINPDECVDCGACRLECDAGAIYYETDLPDDQLPHLADNAAFFSEILPGRDAPIGSPGGATALGRLGVDTPLVSALAPRNP